VFTGALGTFSGNIPAGKADLALQLSGNVSVAQANAAVTFIGGVAGSAKIDSVAVNVAGTLDLSEFPGDFNTIDISLGANKIIVADGTNVSAKFGTKLQEGTIVADVDGNLLAEIGPAGAVVNPTAEEKAAYWADNSTNSVLVASDDLTNVRINLDPAIFGGKVGQTVYVGAYSTLTKLGAFVVKGNSGAPYIDGINVSALPAGSHVFAIYSDANYSDLLDAVRGTVTAQSVEKPVADTAAGFGLGGLAILVALIGAAGVAARRKRA
jgi:hypothetical protein